jgi:hypothetical protein
MGVALLKLLDSYEDYIKNKSRELVRRKIKKCLSKGYSYIKIEDPVNYFDDIYAIF